jgi:hypothetical protein
MYNKHAMAALAEVRLLWFASALPTYIFSWLCIFLTVAVLSNRQHDLSILSANAGEVWDITAI